MLPQINKILYSTDLSKNASYAFQYAASLAKNTGAEIHILHVVEKLSNDAIVALQTYMVNTGNRNTIMLERIKHAKALLQQRQDIFWRKLDKQDVSVRDQIASIDVCESYPVEEIIKRSSALDCDLIVMGTHEKGITQMFLGSVAKNVLRNSRIPTLIVPLPTENI